MGRPVPYVTDAAVVRGVSAWAFNRALARSLAEVLEGLPRAARDEVLATLQAVRQADEAWRSRAAADSGNPAMDSAATLPSSPHDEISTDEAAGMLGVKVRQARNLAVQYGLGRKVGSRWVFSRGAVLAYIEEGQAA